MSPNVPDDANWVKDDLVALSEYAWQRTRARLDGLADDEYLWEPAPQCWSLRPRPDGEWRIDLVYPAPDPAPLTTMAWRIAHLIQCYGQVRNPQMLGIDDGEPDVPWRTRRSGTAAEALDALERAYARWDRVLRRLDDESLKASIGPVGGPYAEHTRAAFVLHMCDEFVHHGAEVDLLRDLYRATTTPMDPPASVEDAARLGDWNRVIALVAGGATIDHTGTTALHLAAGAGESVVVDVLVAHGGDLTARDPDFDATPAEWAAYFGHHDLAAALATRS